jgi:hypothetical protein
LPYPNPGFYGLFSAIVDRAFIRSSPGGRELSHEMLTILAVVAYEDYELFPARKEAKRGAGPKLD